MEANHLFRQVNKILEAMDITSNATRIRPAIFQLKGESQVWWDWVNASRNLEAMTWKSSMSSSWASISRHLLDMKKLKSS